MPGPPTAPVAPTIPITPFFFCHAPAFHCDIAGAPFCLFPRVSAFCCDIADTLSSPEHLHAIPLRHCRRFTFPRAPSVGIPLRQYRRSVFPQKPAFYRDITGTLSSFEHRRSIAKFLALHFPPALAFCCDMIGALFSPEGRHSFTHYRHSILPRASALESPTCTMIAGVLFSAERRHSIVLPHITGTIFSPDRRHSATCILPELYFPLSTGTLSHAFN